MPRRRDQRYTQPEPASVAEPPAQLAVDWRDATGQTWVVRDVFVNDETRAMTPMMMGWAIATHRTFRSGVVRALYTFVDGDRHAFDDKTIADHFERSKRLSPKAP